MSQFLAEDMRALADKINEYLAIVEDKNQDKDEKDEETLDHLLTKPVKLDSIVKNINFNNLNRQLNLNSSEATELRGALEELARHTGKLSDAAAKVIATAFSKMSGVTDIAEHKYDWNRATNDDIKSAIFDAREKARLHPYYTNEAISFIKEATTEIQRRIANKNLASN